MDSYINLNERFIIDKGRRELIDSHTGEIYTDKDEVEKILDTLKEEKGFNRDFERAIRDTWGIKTKADKYWIGWKKDSWFIKTYRTELREYLKQANLSPNAGLLLISIQPYIEYGTNKIVGQKGRSFTNKQLCQMTNMSENTLLKSLNELEDKKFIKRVGERRAREIYFNPYLSTSGNEVCKDTIALFDDYKSITPF